MIIFLEKENYLYNMYKSIQFLDLTGQHWIDFQSHSLKRWTSKSSQNETKINKSNHAHSN